MTRSSAYGRLRRGLDWHTWVAFGASRARQGARRVRGSAFPILESSVAAALAWTFAVIVLHRPDPMFAPIAAWVCLGFKPDRTPRKVAEMGAGATLGVLVGDLATLFTTVGPLQLVVLILAAGLLGRFLDNGDLFTMQIAVNAIVILSFASSRAPGMGSVGDRWMDAVAGALMAFVIAVLMPRRPTVRARRYARSTLSELAVLLELLSAGLVRGDVERLSRLTGQRAALDGLFRDFEETLKTARDVVALNPTLRGYRREVGELWRVYRLGRRALRSTDMLARQSLGMTEEVGRNLTEIGEYVGEVAQAAHRLAGSVRDWHRPDSARQILRGLAGRLAPSEIESTDWRPVALMAIVRSLVVDMLQLAGLSKSEARAELADTYGRPYAARDSDGDLPEAAPEDRHSRLWD